LVGVAVNVTLVPVHITGFDNVEIDIEGTRTGLTVMVIAFEVAVSGLAQVALLVNTQVTI
jgi:hypothetical protein